VGEHGHGHDHLDATDGWCCDGRTYAEHASEGGHCCQAKGTSLDDLPDDGRAKAEARIAAATPEG